MYSTIEVRITHLGILELLFNVTNKPVAYLTDEAAKEKFWPNFTCSGDSSADAH